MSSGVTDHKLTKAKFWEEGEVVVGCVDVRDEHRDEGSEHRWLIECLPHKETTLTLHTQLSVNSVTHSEV